MDATIDIRTWCTVKEAAFQLSVSSVTVAAMVKDGRLRGAACGGGKTRRRLKVDPASIAQWRADRATVQKALGEMGF